MMHAPRFFRTWLFELFIANLDRLISCATVAVWLLIVWGLVWGVAEFGVRR